MSRQPKGTDHEADATERIMRAAISLFAEKGYEATSVREIAVAAGVTKPTLYYHFGSKQGLARAMVTGARESIVAYIAAGTKGASGVREKLVGFVEAHFVGCKENRELGRVLYSLTFSPRNTEWGLDVENLHREASEMAASVVASAREAGLVREDVGQEAAVILTGIINIYLIMFLNRGLPLDRGVAERAVDIFLQGVGTDHRASEG